MFEGHNFEIFTDSSQTTSIKLAKYSSETFCTSHFPAALCQSLRSSSEIYLQPGFDPQGPLSTGIPSTSIVSNREVRRVVHVSVAASRRKVVHKRSSHQNRIKLSSRAWRTGSYNYPCVL